MKRGFTLVELLVVIAIISILAALLMPTLNNVKEQGRKVVCASKLRQMGLGMSMYVTDGYKYPPYMLYPAITEGWIGDEWMGYCGAYYVTWETLLTRGKYLPAPGGHGSKQAEFWRCPSEQHPYKDGMWTPVLPFHHYGLNTKFLPQHPDDGPTGYPDNSIRQSSKVLLIGEGDPNYPDPDARIGSPCVSPNSLYFRHDNRSNVLFTDGHVGDIEQDDPRVGDIDSSLWDIHRN